MPSVTAFDVREIPFARRGSWINLSPVIGLHERADDVHLVSHQTGLHPVLAFVPLQKGERADAVLAASASVLTWSAGEGAFQAVFDTDDTIRVRGTGLDLRLVEASSALTPFTGTYLITDPVDGALVLTSYETGRRYRITVLAGHATIVGDGALGTAERSIELTGAVWEIAIEEFETAREPYVTARSFDDIRREVQA
ncbi:MAG: glycogen debranching protein, partial [Leifsonia sp.]